MTRAQRTLTPIIAGAVTLALAGSAHAATTLTWDGGPDGTGTNYNTAANWNPDTVPAQGDTANIPAAFTVNITGGTTGDGLGTLDTYGAVNFLSRVETKVATIRPTAYITVDYGNGGTWVPRHAANSITFSSNATNSPTLKLILNDGDSPLTALTHEKLNGIASAHLIVDVTNLTKTVNEANPLTLYAGAGGSKDIGGQQSFKSFTTIGGSGYSLVYNYTAETITMVPEPTALALLGVGAVAALTRRRRGAA